MTSERIQEDEPQLRQYLAAVRRHRTFVVGTVAVLLALALLYSFLASPKYEAHAEVLLRSSSTDPLNEQIASADAPRLLNNELKRIESEGARAAAAAAYDGPLDVDDVKASIGATEADVIVLTTTAGNAQEAADLVNAYMDAYIDYRKNEDVAELRTAIAKVQVQLDQVNAHIDEVSAPLTALDQRIATAASTELPTLLETRREIADSLDSQLTALQADREFYQEEIDRLELSAGVADTGGLRVLRSAEVPDSPVSPSPIRNGIIAVAAGLLLGVGVAIGREELDRSVKDHAMLQQITGLPTLGRIPLVPARRARTRGLLVELDPSSTFAESVRSLRTAVAHRVVPRDPSRGGGTVLVVTSPANGEGKSLVAANLAYAMASAGDSVVLVDGDLRRAGLDDLLSIEGPGLSDVIAGANTVGEVMHEHDTLSNLSVIGAGRAEVGINPTEVLASGSCGELIERLAEVFDRVIIDTPPVLPVSDALVLVSRADAVLVVAAERKTAATALERTFESLRQVDAPVCGVVLNRASTEEELYVTRARAREDQTFLQLVDEKRPERLEISLVDDDDTEGDAATGESDEADTPRASTLAPRPRKPRRRRRPAAQ